MAFVREDLRVAELAFDDSLWNQVCFHSHQAAEKSLKSLLALGDVTPPKTYRLMDLATSLEREHPPIGRLTNGLLSLESYYIPTRYPALSRKDPRVGKTHEMRLRQHGRSQTSSGGKCGKTGSPLLLHNNWKRTRT